MFKTTVIFFKFVWNLKHGSSYWEYFHIENNDLKETKITSTDGKMKEMHKRKSRSNRFWFELA